MRLALLQSQQAHVHLRVRRRARALHLREINVGDRRTMLSFEVYASNCVDSERFARLTM
jgi:hypothetical protein